MYSFLPVLLSSILSMVASCAGGGPGPGAGTEAACEDVLARIESPVAWQDGAMREAIIAFVLENRETLASLDAEAALRLWECLDMEPE